MSDLTKLPSRSTATRACRRRLLKTFLQDLLDDGASVDVLMQDPGLRSEALVDYGQYLYASGHSAGDLRNLLLGVQDDYPGSVGTLRAAWNVLAEWQTDEPSEPHQPAPLMLVRAFIVFGVMAGLDRFVLCVALGYFFALRKSEPLRGVRSQVRLPQDTGRSEGPAFFRIPLAHQKGRWARARRHPGGWQHARLDDPTAINLLRLLLVRAGISRQEDALWVESPHAFVAQWNFVCDRIGLDHSLKRGFTPGSLRTGRSTALYEDLGPGAIPALRFLLRHQSE
ncbi:MAG TPA: hypothetical protein EYO90_03845, partial [Candidatus Latescibacteria bacterium]|nr:hypothetical protein [Candidatus Latescibacterota bacterium]